MASMREYLLVNINSSARPFLIILQPSRLGLNYDKRLSDILRIFRHISAILLIWRLSRAWPLPLTWMLTRIWSMLLLRFMMPDWRFKRKTHHLVSGRIVYEDMWVRDCVMAKVCWSSLMVRSSSPTSMYSLNPSSSVSTTLPSQPTVKNFS